jgi:glycosyltransferase involved in cell wall biosynthesis
VNTTKIPRLVPVEVAFERVNLTSIPDDLVTVGISLYNYARFLPDCLESILGQRHPHLDVIVVDDASAKDDSLEVARTWLLTNAESFARVQLLRHVCNQGLAEARNTAFTYARSELVFVMDADNMIYPRALSRLYTVMRDREFDAAYTQLEFFGSEQRLGHADIWERERFVSGNDVDAMALVAKRAWEDVGGYAQCEGQGWEDYDFWCKFVERGLTAAYVPEILCRYRVHPRSMLKTETVKANQQNILQMTMRHPWLTIS